MLKKISLIFIIIILIGSLVGCSNKQANQSDNKIIVGIDDTFVPMGFRDESGEIVGYDIDLAKEAFGRIGYTVEFQPIDWSMKETELESGNIDVIWNGYTITEERKEKVEFTKSYVQNRQVIITLKDSEINSKEDLNGKNVAVQNGSSSLDAINKESDLVKLFKAGKPILFDTNNEAFMDLEAGRTDALVADEIMAKYYMEKMGNEKFKILNDDFGKEEYSVGLRKDDIMLVDELNTTLDNMKNDGVMADISKKWFGEDINK